jgi:hypothetical protein
MMSRRTRSTGPRAILSSASRPFSEERDVTKAWQRLIDRDYDPNAVGGIGWRPITRYLE